MDLKEFKKKIKKVSSHRVYKITNSYGIYDGYKYYRKIKPKDKKYLMSESTYFGITRKINNLLVNSFLECHDIVFPLRMGKLKLFKSQTKIKTDKTGKIEANLCIDWDKTLQLWYEDKESLSKKVLVKHDVPFTFTIRYDKKNTNFNNQSYYTFNVNRGFKLRLKQYIKDNKIDSYLTY